MEKKCNVDNSGIAEIVATYLDTVLKSEVDGSYVEASFDFISKRYVCDRIYIFEFENGYVSNTYEWCAEAIVPQKDLLQAEPVETIMPWVEVFRKNLSVVIYDLEKIRDLHPMMYAGLKPQGIRSLVAAPIYAGEELLGFIGLDNPKTDEIDEIVDFINYISPYLRSFIQKNNQWIDLEYDCYHDKQTGALSVQAYDRFRTEKSGKFFGGILLCDASGSEGFQEYHGFLEINLGIVRAYKILKEVFPFDDIYRICEYKFIVICSSCIHRDFVTKVEFCKSLVRQNELNIKFGVYWGGEDASEDIESMLGSAEKDMYQERVRTRMSTSSIAPGDSGTEVSHSNRDFLEFIKNNYFNSEILVNTVASFDTNYVYFGDLQTNVFYISDNMRDTFGFASNLVTNLHAEWEKSISNQDDLELYRKDINEIVNQKKDVHDLRYRVRDVKGNDIWIHCKGFIHWNQDRTIPLFFSGSFSSQEHDFIVDPVTNFPRETAAASRLQLYDSENIPITIIGFGLNNFAEVNELRGRVLGDQLLSDIAINLLNHFEGQVWFYRLDGLRFSAFVTPDCTKKVEEVVTEIKAIISSQYRSHTIMVKNPCSICVLKTKVGGYVPFEVLSNVISLISMAKNSPDLDYLIHSEESLEKQHRKAEIVMELSNNVENDFENFRIVIQPTVSAEDGVIKGGEVLLRWKFRGKDISPEIFVQLLEKNRQIHSVGRWVFEQTVRAAVRALAVNPDLYLSFNVSYLQILDPSFIPHIDYVLRVYRLDPSKLVMELTETHFDDSPQKLQEFFEICSQKGIQIALDDFGKGYSSLSLLLKYPTQVVKLDRSILNEMSNSEDNQKFIASVVYACHAFGKKVCAEGVETQGERDIMRNAECDLIQGYLYSKPLELDDFYRLIAERKTL